VPVYKLKKGWAFKLNIGKQQIYRSGFKTKNEAKLAEIQLKIQIESGSSPTSDYKVISTASLDSLFKDYLEKEYKITTAYTYYQFFNKHIKKFFITDDITKLTNHHIIKYIKYVNKVKNKNKTKFVSIAKTYLEFLKSYSPINLNLSLLKLQRKSYTEKASINFYTKKEFDNFLKVIDDPNYQLLFSLLFYYGLRIGELKGLQHKDFDFKNSLLLIRRSVTIKTDRGKQVTIDLKTKSSAREYPILQSIKELYKNVYKGYQPKNEHLFKQGETTVRRINKKYAIKAKLKVLKLHEFRHSCASFLINNGMDYMQVSSWLGHKSPTTTLDVYSHLFPSRKKEIANFIDNLD